MKHIIYLATNLINNKKYIGQTKEGRLDRRIFEHINDIPYTKATTIFHAALDKYGLDNFTFEILESNIDTANIDKKEQEYIKQYNTYYKNNCGYNMTLGGQGTHGYVFTEADKKKMSEKNKAWWKNLKENNPEKYKAICKANSERQKGKPKSEEAKRKLSIARKGMVPWNKGLHIPDAFKNCSRAKARITAGIAKVGQYNLKTGEFIQVFESSYTAALAVIAQDEYKNTLPNTAMGRIHKICKEKLGHAYGFIWRHYEDYKDSPLSEDIVKKENKQARAKVIFRLDESYNIIEKLESAASYSKTLSNDYKRQRNIARKINESCLTGKKYMNNYWKYEEEVMS